MSGFSAEWLALREPADRAARSRELVKAVSRVLPPQGRCRVLDLGAGTGANLRFLHPLLPTEQQWVLVDDDASLLKRVAGSIIEPQGVDPHVTTCVRDLGDNLEDVFEGCTLVTASALLDLVPASFVDRVVMHCRDARAVALFALTYDGRIDCEPFDPDDELVRGLVNRHQRTDKGLGPALGPDATAYAARRFAEAGFHVERTRSDWEIDAGARELQEQVIDGWAQAASEIDPRGAALIARWRDRRLRYVTEGVSRIRVGHEDLAAWLP